MALYHGNLTLDDIEDKIYSEEVPKKSLLRFEKIKKREEKEAKDAIEKSQKLKLANKNKKK